MSLGTAASGGGAPREGERHILIAIDDSDTSRRAVLYVADFLGGSPGFRVTLFHVAQLPQEEFFGSPGERDAFRAAREAEGRALLGRCRDMLVQGGFPEEKVGTALLASDAEPVAEVILREQQRLGSCTVVVGRRGDRNRQADLLFGSVSSGIVRRARGCSVWIVE